MNKPKHIAHLWLVGGKRRSKKSRLVRKRIKASTLILADLMSYTDFQTTVPQAWYDEVWEA